jgi:Mg-chelatase subunit ChlD
MDDERLRRWRMVLGSEADPVTGTSLSKADQSVDAALAALYDAERGEPGTKRSAGLGSSAPRVARWLGDIRGYFPSSVVQVMQRDAVERLGITRMLMEPELLNAVEPDVHLVSTLLALNEVMPEETKQTAREVVGRVVADLEKRLAERTRAAVTGALDRAGRTARPRHADIDWDRTIRINLKHFSPALGTIVPDRLVGYARRNHSVQRDIVLAIDQSGSMAESVVYASVFGAVLGSLRSLRTSLVVFDTAVVDLTDQLEDPVDVLFGTQLGGGTDINRALAYCETLVARPAETVVVLISDLYEGGNREELMRRARSLVESGVQVVALLALADSGAPSYDADNAAAFADLGIPTFACTPDLFPDLMAAAIRREDINQWAATKLSGDIVTSVDYQGW